MDRDNIIKAIRTQLGDHILTVQHRSGQRIYIDIAPAAVEQASSMMLDELEARFQIATGVDTSDGIELMYHWALDNEGMVITLRTLLGHDSPTMNSIALLCPAAEWIEREIWELLGVQFTGHPDLRHLLLADDWPEGNYPMRRNHEAMS